MDRNTKSSLTFLQNKLSNNNEVIIITSKFVLYENDIYIKEDNIWKKTDKLADSLINSLSKNF